MSRRCRMLATSLVGAGLLALAPFVAPGATAGTTSATTTTYTPSDAVIANPERGFYHHQSGDCDKKDFNEATLVAYRTNEKITLVMCLFYLAEFKNGPISAEQLERLRRQADTVSSAGLKMIVRFAYTDSEAGDDAPLDRVKQHLDQLAPFFSRNRHVIAVVQSGFVGAWGEGYYTQNFGNRGVVSPTDWANRKAVVDKLLSVVPDDRMVQVRTPKMKRQMYGTTPVGEGNAYTDTPVARVGHHNDCFLADDTDSGTYENVAVEYPYLAADTQHVAMGGETCKLNPPRSDCPTAEEEMGKFHYSYLNRDHKTAVLNSWIAARCMARIEKRLGYRLTLTSATFPGSVRRGTAMPARLVISNTGWAAPYNWRQVKLILRSTATGAVKKFDVNTDPRHWHARTTVTVDKPIVIGLIPVGTYEMLLSLPGEPAHAHRPEYAIQLANVGLWEPATGYNKLLRTITVQP